MRPVLTTHRLNLTWPDGTLLFEDLDLTVPSGRSGLVGDNGTGKSTLLRLLAGDLAPTTGQVTSLGTVGYLPQDLTLAARRPVDDFLGTAAVRAALRAVESGDPDPRHFETIGDAWDIDERTLAELDRVGLPPDVLTRRLGELSGGECTRLGLVRELLRHPDVLLLDEPTNNLDREARRRLYDVVTGWRGSLLVVSHDRDLLERVERVGELRRDPDRSGRRSLAWYGGGWTAYVEAIEVEQEAAARAASAARGDVRRQQQELADAQVKLARRKRYGQKMFENTREPRAVMRVRKRTAAASASAYRNLHQDRLAAARARLADAADRVRDDQEISVDLPATAVPAGREVVVATGAVLRTGQQLDLVVRGPERIAVTGPNGAGKTTVLRTLLGLEQPESGTVDLRVPARLLPQRMDLLDDALSVVENVALLAPTVEDNVLRSRLARFLFRGDAADQAARTLSGGERFRATLAALMLATPAPQLLVLDEPTNNLDLASLGQLVSALASYEGAMLVASHDEAFLEEIGVTSRLAVDRDKVTLHLTP